MIAVQPQARGTQLQDLDGEHVTRPRAADEHRAGDGVDAVEVERGDVARRRVRVELAAGGVGGLELDVVAGLDLQHGAIELSQTNEAESERTVQ